MKIYAPEITVADGWINITSAVETRARVPDIPESISFAFPETFSPMIYSGIEPFTVALLLFAMRLGEDLEVEGTLSKMLYPNLDRYQQIYCAWYPSIFKKIQVKPQGISEDPESVGNLAATHFSGGVDSMFTLYTELQNRDPLRPDHLSHGIYAFFDRQNHVLEKYNAKAEQFEALFKSLDLELIRARTNLRRFLIGSDGMEKNRWINMTYGSGLAAIGLQLSRGLGWLYIPSGMPVQYSLPDGSKLVTNHLLSTERLEIVHHGLVEARGRKTEFIADWPVSYQHLNVCWWNSDGEKNCGKCPKCIRTLTYLEIFDRADRFVTFEPSKKRDRLKWFSTIQEKIFTSEIFTLAWERKKYGIVLVSGLGLALVYLKRSVRGIVQLFRPDYKTMNI